MRNKEDHERCLNWPHWNVSSKNVFYKYLVFVCISRLLIKQWSLVSTLYTVNKSTLTQARTTVWRIFPIDLCEWRNFRRSGLRHAWFFQQCVAKNYRKYFIQNLIFANPSFNYVPRLQIRSNYWLKIKRLPCELKNSNYFSFPYVYKGIQIEHTDRSWSQQNYGL
jgi:hypothetical protein